MDLFRDVSIRRKLTNITMITSGVSLLVACAAFLVFDWYTFRGEMVRNLETLSAVIGDNSTAALAFHDRESAEMTLSALNNEPNIMSACIYTKKGELFAQYRRSDMGQVSFPEEPGEGHVFARSGLEIFSPIDLEGEFVGTAFLRSDMAALHARSRRYVTIVSMVMLGVIAIAFLLSSRLQRSISAPILHLVETSKTVSEEGNYSVRAKKYHQDELGLLTDAFNKMLKQIQKRDVELEEKAKALQVELSERRRAERALKKHSEELARSNAELQDFAYVASHDLQEPLRKIQAFGDRLKSKCGDVLSEQGTGYLERMQSAAARMTTLINGLLSFSRVSTRAQPFETVDLSKVAGEVISDLEVRIEETGGRVDIENLPMVDADPLQMRQLLQNLVGNALKFHRDEEPPHIEITSRIVSNGAKENFVHLAVQDNGIGFDTKYSDRIFGIFQRLHGRNAFPGTGVGLAICRKIAERHGGSISTESSPGRGARFTVKIPMRHAGSTA